MFDLFSDDRGKATCYYHHKIDQPVNVKVFLLIYPSNVSNVLLQIFKLRYGTRNFPFLVSIQLRAFLRRLPSKLLDRLYSV